MHASRARLLVASAVVLSSFACTESGKNTLGPTELELDPVTAAEPSFSVTTASDSCLEFWDISTTSPGEVSPCDAAHGRSGYRGVYFMPSLVGNPNVSGELLSGLARQLIFEVVPFACSGPGCETTRLQVREKGGVYAASWTLNKRDSNLAETYWRVRVSLDTGDGEPVPLAYRDVFQTNSPSSDQPSDGPTLDIQFGSTQSVKIFIEKDACSNVEQAESISCLIGDGGGSLGLITPTGQEIKLDIGTGNGARSYTLATNPTPVDVDVRLIGDAVTVTADPPFAAGERLNGSEIRFCEPSEFDTSGGNDAFVIQQDEYGQSVLPSVDVSCPLFPTSVGLLDGIGDRFASLASLFAPRSLIATAAVKSSGGGGGTLQRLSEFQLAELPSASIASGDGASITLGETIDASVKVEVADGSAAAGVTIRFFAQPGDELTCSDDSTGESCVEVTGVDGLATVGWTPTSGSRSLYALGCGVAVAGEDTPQTVTDGILGVLQSANGGICDRDPTVVDGYVATVDGYANGAGTGVDPFEPFNDTEIALNDLPLVFSATVACDNVGETTVTCEFTDEEGGTLTIDDGTTEVQLNIGPGNGTRAFTLAFNDDAVDVDVRTFGRAVSVTADPPFDPADRLVDSNILFCRTLDTSGANEAYVIQQDADGQSVLPRLAVDCSPDPQATSALDRIGKGLFAAASWLAPRSLIATAAMKSSGGGGGTLQRLSDFDLAEMSVASIASGDGETITEGETISASVKVEVSDGSAAAGATIRFFAGAGDELTCSTGSTATSCVEVTGEDGLATVGWTPALGSDRKLYALGCGIAVAGEDTPQTATDGILGVLQMGNGGICDRDPTVVDGYDASVDGYANGAKTGVDPFEPFNDTEIALNDLPLMFSATVREACNNVGTTTVTCEFTDEEGGTLTIDDGTTEVQLNIGPGNGTRAYTLAFNDNAVDVDVRTFGRAVSVTADPAFDPADRLVDSDILFCRTLNTSGGNEAYVIQQDADGQSVLPRLEVDCPLVPSASSALERIGDGLFAAASWLGPRELIATAAMKSSGGGGGTLQRLSDFDLAEMSSASIQSGDGASITEGETIDASVKVEVADGSAAAGATIRFFAEAGDQLTCSDTSTGTSCVEVTGADGLATVGWTPALGTARKLYALGCGIAVAGEGTPTTATDGILGVLQSGNGGICDRDPTVVDGYDATVDGYANGAGTGVDPFEPFNATEIAINDLPLVFTAEVKAPYTVIEGRSNATDGFGVRFRSFGNRGDTELWLGVGDLESNADRVEADVVWLKDAAVGDGILLTYDPAGAPGGRLLSRVTVPGGEDVTLTYDNVSGTAPAACPASDVDVLIVEIVGRHKGTMIDLRNVQVNGVPITPGSFSGERGTFNWTIEGFDVTTAFTVTGELFLSGEFPPNGDALTKLQISAACLP